MNSTSLVILSCSPGSKSARSPLPNFNCLHQTIGSPLNDIPIGSFKPLLVTEEKARPSSLTDAASQPSRASPCCLGSTNFALPTLHFGHTSPFTATSCHGAVYHRFIYTSQPRHPGTIEKNKRTKKNSKEHIKSVQIEKTFVLIFHQKKKKRETRSSLLP